MTNLSIIPDLGSRRGGGLGRVVNFFIRVIIYDMIISGIANVLGVSRIIALFIFLGLLLAFIIGVAVLRRKMIQQNSGDSYPSHHQQ